MLGGQGKMKKQKFNRSFLNKDEPYLHFFSLQKTIVGKNGIRWNGISFFSPHLICFFAEEVLFLGIAGDVLMIVVFDIDGRFICTAKPKRFSDFGKTGGKGSKNFTTIPTPSQHEDCTNCRISRSLKQAMCLLDVKRVLDL